MPADALPSRSPSEYLAKPGSDVYAPVPTYHDPTIAQDVPIGYKKGDKFIEGCMCADMRSDCKPDKTCRCVGKITREGGNVCDYDRCKACKADPRRCVVRPGCECRKNASPQHEFVCNELCHIQRGPACGHKVSL